MNTVRSAIFLDASFKVMIHGYVQNGSSEQFPQDIKNAYLEKDIDMNVIIVDWGPLANADKDSFIQLNLEYLTAAKSNVPMVANKTKKLLLLLGREGKIRTSQDIHLIGFSLGAHVAGLVGSDLEKASDGKIGRITGLDPAGPLMENKDSSERLDSEDAEFVDVVHTGAGFLGSSKDLGKIDFWANGGRPTQPNCPFFDFSPLPTWCSHNKAASYFIKSIRDPAPIYGCECESKRWRSCRENCQNEVIFGDNVPTDASGVYHLEIETDD